MGLCALLSSRQRAYDHYFIALAQHRSEIARLQPIDEEFDVAADATLFVDDAEAQSRIAPIELVDEFRQCRAWRVDDGDARGIRAQWIRYEHAHDRFKNR